MGSLLPVLRLQLLLLGLRSAQAVRAPIQLAALQLLLALRDVRLGPLQLRQQLRGLEPVLNELRRRFQEYQW